MHVHAFVEEMESIAPPSLAEEFDTERIGLVIEGSPEIERVCCALDATRTVVRKAAAAHADTLVVHHTPIWIPLTTVTGETAALFREILSANLNIYVMHTNFDHATGGVNDVLADLLGLTDRTPLSLGCVGTCSLTIPEISARLGTGLRAWGTPGPLKRLGIVAGSGFDLSLISEASSIGADTFLSSEMKHSVARGSPVPCLESTHYALEAPAMRHIASQKGWQFIDDPPVLSTYL